MKHDKFIELVWAHYVQLRRNELPWRLDISEYPVFVSEVMLQQTQVSRVIPKFESWMKQFPDWSTLANASLAQVLTEWQGLGYNRRGKYLYESAKIVADSWGSQLKHNPKELSQLPGIGYNTAAAILVYTHNLPEVFIETNIRSVYLHHFFKDTTDVSDKEVFRLVEKTLDRENPREWYWALMDYGSYLKKIVPNPNRKSKRYVKQSSFEGSFRQLRARILKQVLAAGELQVSDIQFSDGRTPEAIASLVRDGLVTLKGETIAVV